MITKAEKIGSVIGQVDNLNQNIYLSNESRALPSNIASAPKDFIGREDYLKSLRQSHADGTRVHILNGFGGVGKTALALKFVEEIKNDYDAHIFLNLQGTGNKPLTSTDALLQILHSFNPNIPPATPADELERLYVSLLNQHRILLLLDNAKERSQVEHFNKSRNDCLLVTSRESFLLTGGNPLKIKPMLAEEARNLLFSIASEERFDGFADELAELAGYLPMALLPLAALLAENELETAADLVRKFQNSKYRLELADPTRENLTVFASFDLSYRVLNPELQERWRQLAAFPAEFDEPAAAAVWNTETQENVADETLKQLFKYNLLDWNKETNRFRLPGLARDFLIEKSNKTEYAMLQRRHSKYYKAIVESVDSVERDKGFDEALALFKLEWNNIREAQKWAISAVEIDDEAAIICLDHFRYAAYFIPLMLPPRDYIAAQNAALSAARRLRDRQREGSHLSAIGFAYSNLGKYPEAFESYKEALRIADEVNDRENRIFALSGLGFTCNYLGNFQEAVNFHTKALEMVKDDKEQLRQQGISLAGLGKNYSSATWPEKNYPQAINYFKQALDIARQTEDRQSEISVLGDLGSAYASIGNYQESITNFNLALKAARAIGDRQNEYTSMGNLGLTFLAKYRYQEAVDLFDQALIIARDELSNPLGEGANLDNLAMAYAGLSNLEKAIELSEKSVAIFKSIQSQYNAAASRTLEILREAENQGRAQVNFEEFG